MARPIISNDSSRLYARLDYDLIERTKTTAKMAAGTNVASVQNVSGFSVNDFVHVGDAEKELSQVSQINSINGQVLSLNPVTSFAYDNKTNIYKMDYDLVKFYADDTVVATVSLKPDYLVSAGVTVQNSVAYTMSYFNTDSDAETAKGEVVYATDNMLCSPGDVAKYESIDILGTKVIDKIDIASRDIRNIFRAQDQNVSAVDDRNLLRSASALLSLRYIFTELSKSKDDVSSKKSEQYGMLYDNEIRRIMEVINKEDSNVRVMGQTRAIR